MTDYNLKAVELLEEVVCIDQEISELDAQPRVMTPEGYRREPSVHARIQSLISRRRDLVRLADTYANMALRQELERLVNIADRHTLGITL